MRISTSEVQVAVCHLLTFQTSSPAVAAGESFASLLERLQDPSPDPGDLLSFLERLVQALRRRLKPAAGWGVQASASGGAMSMSTRREQTTVEARGTVQTTDGRSVSFRMDLALHRTEAQAIPAGALQDPLVLTYDGPSAQLAGKSWRFDLNGDGKEESLPGLAAGSGLLVFDKDGDHVADNGNELFGAGSGQGFQDLQALDADHNGWIDEADPAWKQLMVWNPGDPSGPRNLPQMGIGALWTRSAESPFRLEGGELRATGLFLREDGRAGALQQVDFRSA